MLPRTCHITVSPFPNNHREHRTICQCNMVPCSIGCGKSLLRIDVASHENSCKASCTCQCGTNYGSKLYRNHHEKFECQLRIVTCEKCGKNDIAMKSLAYHKENTCELRIVNCTVRTHFEMGM